MPTRTAGPIRVNPWCGTRRSAAHDVSNVTDGLALAHVPNHLNGYFIRLDLTVDKRLDLAWTYEMLYYAHIAFDPSADAFHGRGIGIQDGIDFYGRTPEKLRKECKNSVEDYLTWCAEEGTKPEKTRVGKLTMRVDEDLRRRLAVVAAASGASVNAWITALLDRETKRVLQEHEVVG